MFDWISTAGHSVDGGRRAMQTQLCGMLDDSHRALEMASAAFLGETPPETIQRALFKTDKKINRAERQIRQQIVAHATEHGVVEFPQCLILMSIAKDAERLGDYGKNLFDVAKLAPSTPIGEIREDFIRLKTDVLALLKDCSHAVDEGNREAATRVIVSAKEIEDCCDERVTALIRAPAGDAMAPTWGLVYRYYKRTASHCRNIASSVVQPLHKLDFTSKITVTPD